MSGSNSRFDTKYVLLLPGVLYATWPWFTYRMPTIVPFSCFLLWCFLMLGSRKVDFWGKARLNLKFIGVLILFCMFSYLGNLFAFFGHGDFVGWFEYATTGFAVSHFVVMHLSFKQKKFNEIVFLTVVALIGLSLAGIGAIRGGMIEGFEGGRALTTAVDVFHTDQSIDNVIMARTIGSANYGATYAFALFFIPVLFMVLEVKRPALRFLSIVVSISILLVIKNSGLGTPVFVMVLGCLYFFATRVVARPRFIIAMSVFTSLSLVVFAYNQRIFSVLSPLPRALGSFFDESSSIRWRCDSVAAALEGDTYSYAAERYKLQKRSIDAFFDHPFGGTGMYKAPHPKAFMVGGHSCLLDRLGQAGILGGVLYFAFLIGLYRYYAQLCLCFGFDRRWLSILLSVMACYIFACIANPSPTYPGILYYIPGVFLLVARYGKRRMPVL